MAEKLPGVAVLLGNGNLGGTTPTDDGVAGIVISGAATDKVALLEAKQIFDYTELAGLGITAENNPVADAQVKAFYEQAGSGAELYIILISNATLLADVCAATGDTAVRKLLDAAQGRIRLLGIIKDYAEGYEPTTTQGIDSDVITAMSGLNTLLNSYANAFKPARALLPGAHWDGTATALINLRESSFNRVGVVLGANDISGLAAIGTALGRLASIPVHRNIGRVKDGSVLPDAFMTDGEGALIHENLWPSLHEKGFIFFRKFQGKNGFYFNDDPVAAPLTDDYSSLSKGRTIDKALTIVYSTYVDEILDNVEVDAKGQISAAACKYYEGRINNAVNANMSDEISSFRSYVDPAQNVLSTSLMKIVCAIVPQGQLKEIVVELGFENPALNQ